MQSMKNTFSSSPGKPKKAGERIKMKGSQVTEERAKAQRAKLDTQAKAHQRGEKKEAATHVMLNKKMARQDYMARGRFLETLIEAYIQDHIGGNHSEKTLEWHRTALGLMRLFLEEEVRYYPDR